MRRAIASVLPLLLLACADPGQPTQAGETDSGTETDSDSDTDSETETDTDTDTDSDSETDTGDSGDGDSGDGDSGDGDSGDTDPPGCEWTNFPSQYDIGSDLGQSCGTHVNQSDPDPEGIATLLACLEAAYEANEAAWGRIEHWGGADSDVDVRLYVRPHKAPSDGWKPRRIQTIDSSTPLEQGGYDKFYWVDRCHGFVADNCEPFGDCNLCVGADPLPCGQKG